MRNLSASSVGVSRLPCLPLSWILTRAVRGASRLTTFQMEDLSPSSGRQSLQGPRWLLRLSAWERAPAWAPQVQSRPPQPEDEAAGPSPAELARQAARSDVRRHLVWGLLRCWGVGVALDWGRQRAQVQTWAEVEVEAGGTPRGAVGAESVICAGVPAEAPSLATAGPAGLATPPPAASAAAAAARAAAFAARLANSPAVRRLEPSGR